MEEHGSTIGATEQPETSSELLAAAIHISSVLVKSVDHTVQASESTKPGRTHLGASVMGRQCLRSTWYGFRWYHRTKHQGRLLRLFRRGHREEDVFAEDLRSVGVEVRLHSERLCYHSGSDSYFTQPWDQEVAPDVDDISWVPAAQARARSHGVEPKQYTFADHNGHFGGSCDGQLHATEAAPELIRKLYGAYGPGLAEFKTHGEKSFIDLAGKLEDYRKYLTTPTKVPFPGKGVLTSKLEHYIQMQLYMKYFGLKWALYCAINKNTDDLYYEVVMYREEMAEAYADKAAAIIGSQHPPPKYSKDPSWFVCKFCDFREVCHKGVIPQVNCRSCMFSKPVENGEWRCDKFNQIIPEGFIATGCDNWSHVE